MISLPERGAPVDTGLFYEIIEQLNSISGNIATQSGNTSKIITPSGSNDSMTAGLRVYGMFKKVSATVEAGKSLTFGNIPFPGTFKYAPIAVATPVIEGPGVRDFFVVLTSVTTASVGLDLHFKTAGPVDARINILAIGIPEGVA